MKPSSGYQPHTFFIPVMGTSFTIDTPLKVAKYGISSVVSLSDDVLIEKMRKHHCELSGLDYEPVRASDPDSRSKRISRYLNLLDTLVKRQFEKLRNETFERGSDLHRYFELLPETELKQTWRSMERETNPVARLALQEKLRNRIRPGRIDVNIMTKVDPEMYRKGEKLAPEFGLAQQAMKGFAESNVHSGVVFSAGMNPGLYSYAANFKDFYPSVSGRFSKEIILKVSDFRSALVQGKFLARRGLWVSEFRIESGINCGGHAFVSRSQLMGPVLDEFQKRREELTDTLLKLYRKALAKDGLRDAKLPDSFRITAQGGIGTASEHQSLINCFGLDAAGWGTPFLLVPEVVSIDDDHLDKLLRATDKEVYLSEASPLGVPFWMLRGSASEENREALVASGTPGSSCPRGYLKFNSEFSEEPICTASKEYQEKKLVELEAEEAPIEEKESRRNSILARACLCRDLAGSALARIGKLGKAKPVVCCGPNISNFSLIASFKEMVDHIYGRLSLLTNPKRPHMFIREMGLYIGRMRETISESPKSVLDGLKDQFAEFEDKVSAGISYYRERAGELVTDGKEEFLKALSIIGEEFEQVKKTMSQNLATSSC